MTMRIFEGTKILDFSQVIAGSYATTIMADMGAEVVKVEPPVTGDSLRNAGPMHNGESGFFLLNNRNKKSISIDLKKEEGVALIKELIPHFDIVAENFKPGVMDKFGLGYEDVKKIKKDIIYVSVSGYGHNNDYSDRPAYDNMIQAMSGLASLNGRPTHSAPLRSPLSISDYTSGLYSAFALSSALYHKMKTGQGQYIDIAMYDSLISIMDNTFLICDYEQENIRAGVRLEDLGLKSTGNSHPGAAPHGFYRTRDGYIAHMSLTDEMWNKLLTVIGEEELIGDEKYCSLELRKKNWRDINTMVEEWTLNHTTDEIRAKFREYRLPCGKARTIDEVYNDPHNEIRGVFQDIIHPIAGKVKITNIPIKFSETPPVIHSPSPQLGEHNFEIIGELLGYSKEQFETFLENKVLFHQ